MLGEGVWRVRSAKKYIFPMLCVVSWTPPPAVHNHARSGDESKEPTSVLKTDKQEKQW